MTVVGGEKKVKTCSIMVGGGGGGRDFVTAPKTMFLVVVVQEDGETKRIRTLFFSVAKRGSLYLVSH